MKNKPKVDKKTAAANIGRLFRSNKKNRPEGRREKCKKTSGIYPRKSDQPHFLRDDHRLSAVGCADRAQKGIDMQLDGCLRHAHFISDLLV